MPLRTARAQIGILGIRPATSLNPPDIQALLTLADQAAAAVERVRLAAAAARTEAQAETQKLRTALLNSLSHDLRTPLTGIRGAAGSLRTSWDQLPPAVRTDLLASIEQDTVRMTRFLSNIMEMTRLETGEVAPRLEPVALLPLVEHVALHTAGLTNIDFKTLDSLPQVLADPALLEQILTNLLENAAKYGPDGGLVTVSGQVSAGMVMVSVSDDGPGIARDDLPNVFDSFYRAHREDRTIPGTGLGLAIARGLTEAMGGRIEAQSPRQGAPRDGAPGTTITISLPMEHDRPGAA
jgi:two-component system sensor histidine kinase KdpD